MANQYKGTYCGNIPELKGKTALLMEDGLCEGCWMAQFDELGLSSPTVKAETERGHVATEDGMTVWSHDWHFFYGSEFTGITKLGSERN